MGAFIDDHRATYGVAPICAVLPIAPSTYYELKARERDPSRCSARAHRDAALRPEITRVYQTSRRRYGAKKVWMELKRERRVVARGGAWWRAARASGFTRAWGCTAWCGGGA